MPMNTTRPTPARIRKSKELLDLSAVTFLALCVWMGPHAACWFIAIAAIVAGWVWLCRRFPTFGCFTLVFFDGFLGGLFGYRSGYYRPRRWR
jgi:hypothetical protein